MLGLNKKEVSIGCNISLCIYKLKTLEQAKKAVPGACFQDLYDNYILLGSIQILMSLIQSARELTAAALRKLYEQGAVMHLGYAYWNYVLR